MQGGLHAANTIVRRLDGKDSVPFKYRDLGSVATLGRFRAIASVKRLHLRGIAGWLVWMFVHLAFLEGYGNRFSTMLRWLRSMVGRGRAEREFPVAHVGGDLSLPDSVREVIQPAPFPLLSEQEQTVSPGDHQPGGGLGVPPHAQDRAIEKQVEPKTDRPASPRKGSSP
jgi:hypothetical protein